MKDLALTGKEFVRDADASHGLEMQTCDGVSNDLSDFGFFAAIFLNGFESTRAKFSGTRFVLSKIVGGFGVEIPTVVIKARLHGGHFHADGSKALHIEKADDDVRDLNPGVINVILDLNGVSGVAKDARHGVAKDGVAEMADVRGFVGIDACVLDDDFSGFFC